MKTVQSSYAAGVLAPSLRNRTDLAKWQIGLSEANNLLVKVHGGIENRAGLVYDETALGPNRLIPFEYAVDDAYILEFGEYVMRIFRGGELLVEPETTETVEAVIFGLSDYLECGVPFTTSSDTKYVLKLQNFNIPAASSIVSALGLGFNTSGKIILWSYDTVTELWTQNEYSSLTTLVEGNDYEIWLERASGSSNIKITVVDDTNQTIDISATGQQPFEYDSDLYSQEIYSTEGQLLTVESVTRLQGGAEVIDLAPDLDGYMHDTLTSQVFYNRNTLTNKFPLDVVSTTGVNPDAGEVLVISSPFAYADLAEVRYVQREDVLFMVHPDYGEYALTRYGATQWTMAPVEYTPDVAAPDGLTYTPYGLTVDTFPIEYMVAAVDANGVESLPSDPITAGAESSAAWTAGAYLKLEWGASANADLYVVYKSSRGYFGYIGSTTELTFTDDNIAPDSADGPKVNRTPFSGANNQPSAVGIYQQRKVYGRTNSLPQTVWATQTGTMDNLAVSRPLKDTDAITAQLDSNQVNQILHLVAMKDLVVITNNGVWTLGPGANSDLLTPTNARFDLQSTYGGSRIAPIVAGNTILMVPDYRRGVREMFYQIQAGGFEGTPLEIMSNHLFLDDQVKEWAFQRDDNIIWCVMESGQLNALTYMREHDVVAWTTHDTQGSFESVAVIRGTERDIPYFTVKRTIGGAETRFVEHLADRLPAGVLDDGIFMDAALSTTTPSLYLSGDASPDVSGQYVYESEGWYIRTDGLYRIVEGGTWTTITNVQTGTVLLRSPDLEGTYTPDYGIEGLTLEGELTAFGSQTSGVVLSADGTKAFVVVANQDYLTEYTLLEPFNIETETQIGYRDLVADFGVGGTPSDLDMRADGKRLRCLDRGAVVIYSYPLTTAWTVSSMQAPDQTSPNFITSFSITPTGFNIFDNESKMLVSDLYGNLCIFALDTPGDVSALTLLEQVDISVDLPGTLHGCTINEEGDHILVVDNAGFVLEYALSTQHTLSTRSLIATADVSATSADPQAIYEDKANGKIYLADWTSDSVYGWSVDEPVSGSVTATVPDEGTPSRIFGGAGHLAGMTCVVLADGNVIEDVVVEADGTFTLDNAYTTVHIGLPYVSDFETLDVDYALNDGTGFADRKAINRVTLALENTRGLQVGPSSDELVEMKDRTDEGYNEATRMTTGKKDIQIPPHWNSNGRVHVRQAYPLPMTILSHIPEVTPGDD